MPVLPEELLGIVASFTPRAIFLARAGRAWWRAAGEHFWRALVATMLRGRNRLDSREMNRVWVTPAGLVARFPRLGALAPYEAPGLPRFEELPDTFAEPLRERWRAHKSGHWPTQTYFAVRGGSYVIENFREGGMWHCRVNGGEKHPEMARLIIAASAAYFVCAGVESRALSVHDRRAMKGVAGLPEARVRVGMAALVADSTLLFLDHDTRHMHLVDLTGSKPPGRTYVGSGILCMAVCGAVVAFARTFCGPNDYVDLIDLSDISARRTLPVPRVATMTAVGDALVLNGSLRINTS